MQGRLWGSTRSQLVSCRGVGRGAAHAEASRENGPSGTQFAVEAQVSDGQQDIGLEKERHRIKSPRAWSARLEFELFSGDGVGP